MSARFQTRGPADDGRISVRYYIKCDNLGAWDVFGRRGLEHVSQAEAKVFEKRSKGTALAVKVFAEVRKQERLCAKMS